MTAEPSWTSLLPPLLAIGLAVAFREVILALWVGVFAGALLLGSGNPLAAAVRTVDTHVLGALADADHAAVVIFTLMLGGMVGVISRSGGSLGLAGSVTRLARDPRRGQVAAWLMGIFVFFDDFANTLLVGPTMRPISDRLRLSREKLAFIVDATAAPVASIAVISSWIGMEIGYIADQYRALGIEQDAYWVFLRTVPHRFYPLLMLWFGLLVAVSGRDFGPMLRAERRARREGKPLRDGARPAASFEDAALAPRPGVPQRMLNALVPIGVVILVIAAGLGIDGLAKVRAAGLEPGLRNILAQADSYRAMLWASLAGSITAIGLVVGQRLLGLGEAMQAWLAGMKSMVLAMVILTLAWALGGVCQKLHTADYMVKVIGPWLSAGLLPALVFLVSALVSFATGTSWGTMGILFPIVVPLAHGLAPGSDPVMLGAISSILAGSVFGDHCSPISDTTIMSSLACSCDHIDHVRTQLPYALLAAVAACLAGVFSFEDGLRLVRERGRLMHEVGQARPGAMAAVIGLDEETVAEVCRQASERGVVTVANINSPEQVVISGQPEAVEAAGEIARQRGAKGVVPLKVSAAFHSPLMQPVRDRLAEVLEKAEVVSPRLPVLANVTAQPHDGPEDLRRALIDQVDHPVRWWQSMKWILDKGFETCYEIGPGRVLAGMLKRIDRRARCTSLGEVSAVRRASASARSGQSSG